MVTSGRVVALPRNSELRPGGGGGSNMSVRYTRVPGLLKDVIPENHDLILEHMGYISATMTSDVVCGAGDAFLVVLSLSWQ